LFVRPTENAWRVKNLPALKALLARRLLAIDCHYFFPRAHSARSETARCLIADATDVDNSR